MHSTASFAQRENVRSSSLFANETNKQTNRNHFTSNSNDVESLVLLCFCLGRACVCILLLSVCLIWCCWLKSCPYFFILLKHYYEVTFVFLYFLLIWFYFFLFSFCVFLFYCYFYCTISNNTRIPILLVKIHWANQNCTYLTGESEWKNWVSNAHFAKWWKKHKFTSIFFMNEWMNVSLSFFVSVSVCVLHVFIFFCSVRCSTVHSLSLFCFIVNCHNRNKESHYCRKKMEKNRKKPFSTRFFLPFHVFKCMCLQAVFGWKI